MVLMNDTDLVVSCHCGCEEGLHIQIDNEIEDLYCLMSYTHGKYYCEQNSIFDRIKTKLSKIWHIIRGKDFYYSDIIMTKKDFELFKEYINKFD